MAGLLAKFKLALPVVKKSLAASGKRIPSPNAKKPVMPAIYKMAHGGKVARAENGLAKKKLGFKPGMLKSLSNLAKPRKHATVDGVSRLKPGALGRVSNFLFKIKNALQPKTAEQQTPAVQNQARASAEFTPPPKTQNVSRPSAMPSRQAESQKPAVLEGEKLVLVLNKQPPNKTNKVKNSKLKSAADKLAKNDVADFKDAEKRYANYSEDIVSAKRVVPGEVGIILPSGARISDYSDRVEVYESNESKISEYELSQVIRAYARNGATHMGINTNDSNHMVNAWKNAMQNGIAARSESKFGLFDVAVAQKTTGVSAEMNAAYNETAAGLVKTIETEKAIRLAVSLEQRKKRLS